MMKRLQRFFCHSWPGRTLADEQGSVLVISLLILVVLAMLGVVASNMSITELQSAGNEKRFNQSFYLADSGWQVVPNILDDFGGDAPKPKAGCNGAVECGGGAIDGVPYTYTVTEVANPRFIKREGLAMDGSYTVYQYQVDSTADSRQKIRVILNKPYQTN